MFFLSLAAIFVLSQYYRFQEYPLLLCIIVQYVVLIALVILLTWIAGQFHPLHEDACKDMVLSFTVPYIVGVLIYYISLFHEIKRANQSLKNIKEGDRHELDRAIIILIGVVAFELCTKSSIRPLILRYAVAYVPSQLLAFVYVWFSGFREELAKTAYRDILINFTSFFILLSIIGSVISICKEKKSHKTAENQG